MATETQTQVLELERGATGKLRVSLGEFKQAVLVDLRLFYETAAGDWRPTRKGITLRDQGEIDAVIAKLQELRPNLPGPTI